MEGKSAVGCYTKQQLLRRERMRWIDRTDESGRSRLSECRRRASPAIACPVLPRSAAAAAAGVRLHLSVCAVAAERTHAYMIDISDQNRQLRTTVQTVCGLLVLAWCEHSIRKVKKEATYIN